MNRLVYWLALALLSVVCYGSYRRSCWRDRARTLPPVRESLQTWEGEGGALPDTETRNAP